MIYVYITIYILLLLICPIFIISVIHVATKSSIFHSFFFYLLTYIQDEITKKTIDEENTHSFPFHFRFFLFTFKIFLYYIRINIYYLVKTHTFYTFIFNYYFHNQYYTFFLHYCKLFFIIMWFLFSVYSTFLFSYRKFFTTKE